MEKRIFVAILISIAFLWLWATAVPRIFPELVPPAPTETSASATATGSSEASTAVETAVTTAVNTATTTGSEEAPTGGGAPAAPVAPVSASSRQNTVIDTPNYRAVLSNRGGQIVSYRLKHYTNKRTDDPVDLVKARAAHRTDYPFTIVPAEQSLHRLNSALYAVSERTEGDVRIIEYRYSDGRVTATKTFRFGTKPYMFDFSVSITPPSPFRIAVGPGIATVSAEEEDTQVIITGNGVVEQDGDFEIIPRAKAANVEAYPGVDYIGIEDNYFLTALQPSRAAEGVLQRVSFFEASSKKRRDDLYAGLNAQSGVVAGQAFFGPKETNLLDAYGMGDALQFGWFGLIARFFLEALVWLNQFTKNYGFAIIVLTILIKVVLYPLQHKSIVSMKRMQKVQPKVEAIRAKYKKSKTDAEQRQKMNTEMMQLYQKEGINPAAGCLPMILQLPILWGFYNLLSRAIELRGAPFILWIQDLSDKDPYYITPILMTATMFIQTYITPMTGDPMQRKIFLFMPLIFGFLFKDFPSGLVLYWLVQNILTIVQQLIMNKWWKNHPEEVSATVIADKKR